MLRLSMMKIKEEMSEKMNNSMLRPNLREEVKIPQQSKLKNTMKEGRVYREKGKLNLLKKIEEIMKVEEMKKHQDLLKDLTIRQEENRWMMKIKFKRKKLKNLKFQDQRKDQFIISQLIIKIYPKQRVNHLNKLRKQVKFQKRDHKKLRR